MGISFGSINTGLPKDIVKQIVAAERIPIQQMEVRKGKFQDKKKLVQALSDLIEKIRGSVDTNKRSNDFRELKVDTRNDIINVALDKNIARPGNYQFEVVDLAQKSSAMTSGFKDPDDSYVGVGFIQYTLPNGDTKEVYVDSDNASLNKVAKLINEDSSNGMRANVVNDGSGTSSPFRLIVSLEETGDDERADFPYFYFVDGIDDFYIEKEREAGDAIIKLDGFELEVPKNKIKDLIPGATIDLLKAAPGEEFSIKISENINAITEKIKKLIDGINAVLKFIIDQNTLDETSDTSRTLGGDILLQTLESKLRNVLLKPYETSDGTKRLNQVGVQFQRTGLITLDEKKLASQLSSNYIAISELFTGFKNEDGVLMSGFLQDLSEFVGHSLRVPDGILPGRKRGLDNNIEQMDRRIDTRERIITQREKTLKDRFAQLESTISRLRSQGAGLAGLGGQTPNIVQQLG